MLLDLVCFECILEQHRQGVPNQKDGEPIMTPFEPVNNTGIYDVTCSQGHKTKVIIDHIDFEILFEYGLNAIADGYFREAVSSITSAMERYYEFFTKVILFSTDNNFETIDNVWKKMSNQSERQLGSYISLYTQTFKEEPILLSNTETAFRNSVIHILYIPTREESIAYGNYILNLVYTSFIKLKTKFPETTNATFEYYGYSQKAENQLELLKKDTEKELIIGTLNLGVTIDVKRGRELRDDDGRKGNVEQRLPSILKHRNPRKLIMLKNEPSKE
jgi:hypothetical protein